jgi:hypothetical protein
MNVNVAERIFVHKRVQFLTIDEGLTNCFRWGLARPAVLSPGSISMLCHT